MVFGHEEIERLKLQLQEEQARNVELERQLSLGHTAGIIAVRVEDELRSLQASGAVQEQAESMVEVTVVTEERDRLAKSIAKGLRTKEYERCAAKVRDEQGPTIKAHLLATFEEDGTFARLRATAENNVRATLQTEVLEEEKSKIDAELTATEVEAQMREALRSEVLNSDSIKKYRARVRYNQEDTWRQEVEKDAQGQIDEEEAAREGDFKAGYIPEAQQKLRRHRTEKRETLERQWRDKMVDEVAAAIDDEELKDLLAKRAEQEKVRLEKEYKVRKLLEAFEGHGIDMNALGENTRVSIYLGEVAQIKIKGDGTFDPMRNSYRDTIDVADVKCARKLDLLALGDGRFIVNADSLHDSESVYERASAFRCGKIIKVGRKIEEAGVVQFDAHVAADVPLYVDTDTTDEKIEDAVLNVADIKIDGFSARSIEHIQMPGQKPV